MKEFIRKHYDHIHGVLSCFDRMLFRGYLPIMSGWAMAQFRLSGILRCKLKYNNNNVLPGVSWLGSEVDHGGQV
jgi:hypothetical protein